MKLPDALRGIRQLAIDSAPLIYLIEKHPVYLDRVVFIMRYIHSGPIEGVASVLALPEVVTVVTGSPLEKGRVR